MEREELRGDGATDAEERGEEAEREDDVQGHLRFEVDAEVPKEGGGDQGRGDVNYTGEEWRVGGVTRWASQTNFGSPV